MKWQKTFLAFGLGLFLCALGVSAANVTTSVVTAPAATILTQSDYRWYNNENALTPASPLGAEDVSVSTPASGSALRLRINIKDASVALDPGAIFRLQYANSSLGPWTDVGTSTAWIFFDNPGVADGQIIATTVLSNSDTGESYGESNPSALTPNAILSGQRGEWDWVLQNNTADTASNWFFRMVTASGTALDSYSNYPKLIAVPVTPPAPPPSPPPSGGGVNVGASGGSVGSGAGNAGGPASSSPQETPLPIPPPIVPPYLQGIDLNGDNHVDIIDLSILLYHYNETGLDVGLYDLNHDGTVNFPDVSILMYYWTE